MFAGKKVSAVLLAGGTGSRFGADGNKVYVEIGEKPVLRHSMEVLEQHPDIDEWILVVRAGEECEAGTLTGSFPWKVTAGGAERRDSVLRGLQAASGEIVLVQDGARPLLRPAYVSRCLAAMTEAPGCTVAVRSKDTVKLGDSRDFVRQSTRREETWIIQTPQCFHRDVLLAAHERFRETPGITDDCMLLELAGEPVKLVEGDYSNIKITTPEDRELAEVFLRRSREGE